MDEELGSFPYLADGISPARSEPDLFQQPVREEETAKKLHRVKSAPSLFSLEVLPPHSYVSRAQRTVSTDHKHRRNSSHPQEVDVVRSRAILESSQPPQKPLVSISEPAMEKMRDRVCDRYEILSKPQFYLAANLCFLFGLDISPCALCVKGKKRPDAPKSHILPKCLLKSYGKIHCPQEVNFIYDPATHSKKKPRTLVHPLFCHDCETKASLEERFLRDVYLQIMTTAADQHPAVEVSQSHRLRHILAILLFRGILMAVNMWNEWLSHENFFNFFMYLRDYCLETDVARYSEMQFAKKIHLFLLPNTHFNPLNERLCYTLDFQLRNPGPRFTTVIKVGNSYCFYMKFDCFHWVVPLDNSDLNTPGSCFADCNHLDENFLLLNHKEAMEFFPRVLLEHNRVEAGQLLEKISGVSKQPYIAIELVPKHWEQNPQDRQCTPLNERLRQRNEILDSLPRGPEELQGEANKNSPLKDVADDIKRELTEKSNEIAGMRAEEEKMKALIGQRYLDMYNLHVKNQILQEDKEDLQRENKSLKDKNEDLRRKYEDLQQENKKLKDENEQLQNEKLSSTAPTPAKAAIPTDDLVFLSDHHASP